ncbi:receptor-type protein kinase, putative, partial [Bodo saltans]
MTDLLGSVLPQARALAEFGGALRSIATFRKDNHSIGRLRLIAPVAAAANSRPTTVLMLQHLDITYCDYVGDSTIAFIVMLQKLRLLNVSLCGTYRISDAGLETIASGLVQLKHLYLSGCGNITNAGIEKISWLLLNLEELHLGGCCSITDEGFKNISLNLDHLRQLRLSRILLLSDDGLSQIRTLRNLQLLDLSHCNNITVDGLKHIALLRQLQHLDLSCCSKITDITPLTTSPLAFSLCALVLGGLKITDAGLSGIASLTLLRSLCLCCSNITNMGIIQIASLQHLECLCIGGCKFTDVAIARIAPLMQLQCLNLSDCEEITCASLWTLKCMRDLRTLEFSRCTRIHSAGLAGLASFHQLQHLNLNY